MVYKPVGADTDTSLFPPRVMTALRNIFSPRPPANTTPGFVATVASDGSSIEYKATGAASFDGGMDF